MNLNDCLRQAADELLAEGAEVTTQGVVDRALEINGALTEFEEKARTRAMRSLRSDAKRILQEAGETDVDEDDPDLRLFELLPGRRPAKAIALPGDGEYVYKGYKFTTDDDLAAHETVCEENITRAVNRLRDHNEKRKALAPFRSTPETTTIEALAGMAASKEQAA